MTMCALHIAVLVRFAHPHQGRLYTGVGQQTQVTCSVLSAAALPFASAANMRCRRALIGLTKAWAAAQLHQRTLQSTLQRQVTLAVTDPCPLPVGVGQY